MEDSPGQIHDSALHWLSLLAHWEEGGRVEGREGEWEEGWRGRRKEEKEGDREKRKGGREDKGEG